MKKLLKLAIFVTLIAAFIYFGTKEYDTVKKKKKDEINASSVLLNGEYVFSSTNHSKILNRLSSKNDSIIYICVDGNKLCTKYGILIDEVVKSYGIEKVYYYDIEKDRENNNGTYEKILSKLSKYAVTNDLGKQTLYAPTLIFIKNGSVYNFDDSLSINHGNKDIDELWNEEVINAKREYLTEVMEGYVGNE